MLESIKLAPSIKIAGVGDLMLAGYVASWATRSDEEYPFGNIAGQLKKYDVIFGNLETPLSNQFQTDYSGEYPRFAAPEFFAQRLKKAGFSVLSLANNHILDYGQEGLSDTLEALTQAGIATVGIIDSFVDEQVPVIIERKGKKIGFLAYALSCCAQKLSRGTVPAWPERVHHEIIKLRNNVDVLVVSLHVGIEYTPVPNFRMRHLYMKSLDWGADIVFGHHSHVPQGLIERGSGKIIFCSLGNFVSDMHISENRARNLARAKVVGNSFAERYQDQTRHGLLAEVSYFNGELRHAAHPIFVDERGAPRLELTIKKDSLKSPTLLASVWIEFRHVLFTLIRRPCKRGKEVLITLTSESCRMVHSFMREYFGKG